MKHELSVDKHEQELRQLVRLAIAFVALNALDLTMTLLCVWNGQSELNPIMRFILAQPFYVTVLFKVGLSALFAANLVLLKLRTVLHIIVYATAGICVWNMTILLMLT